MTAAPAPRLDRIAELPASQFRARLGELLQLYATAMGYPPEMTRQRASAWSTHPQHAGFRCVGAFDQENHLLGFSYGYIGERRQWWHEQVRRGLLQQRPGEVDFWLQDYFELTELHVRPDCQGGGLGEQILRTVLAQASGRLVLLSTPEGPSRAWKLYRRVGFVDVLRHYCFAGDSRPFAVLGRTLPLDPLPSAHRRTP